MSEHKDLQFAKQIRDMSIKFADEVIALIDKKKDLDPFIATVGLGIAFVVTSMDAEIKEESAKQMINALFEDHRGSAHETH